MSGNWSVAASVKLLVPSGVVSAVIRLAPLTGLDFLYQGI
jgi:hypothetical protein